jgi:hypothetical protein
MDVIGDLRPLRRSRSTDLPDSANQKTTFRENNSLQD